MDTPTTLGNEQSPQSTAPRPGKLHFILGFLGVALGMFVALFRAWIRYYGTVNAEMMGAVFGSALLPALIAYLIAGRKRVRNFNRFGFWFAGLSIVFFAVTNRPPVSLQQHFVNLMKEAAGTKPLDDSGPRKMDDLVRGILRDILNERKAFDQDAGQFAPVLHRLYSAESFSSEEAMQRSRDAVRGAALVDQHYSEEMESLPDRIQARAVQAGLSDSEAKDFTEGMRKSFGDSKALSLRRKAMEVERQWAEVTVALYEFAMANAAWIRVDGPHLVIANEKVRTAFTEQMKESQTLRESLTTLNAQMEVAQREGMQQLGMAPKDLGLDDNGQPAKK